MGGPEDHPGSTPDHIRQCDSEADVRAKGRMAYMEAAIKHVDVEEMQWLRYHTDKYTDHKKKSQEIIKTKEEALVKIDQVLRDSHAHTISDFDFLINTFDLIQYAHEVLANSYILRFYETDEDK